MIKTSHYVIAGMKSGKLEYLGHDSHSGGYPYAASFTGASGIHDVSKIPEYLKEAEGSYVGIANPKLYEVCLHEIETSDIAAEYQKVEEILYGLTEIQKKILKQKLVKR